MKKMWAPPPRRALDGARFRCRAAGATSGSCTTRLGRDRAVRECYLPGTQSPAFLPINRERPRPQPRGPECIRSRGSLATRSPVHSAKRPKNVSETRGARLSVLDDVLTPVAMVIGAVSETLRKKLIFLAAPTARSHRMRRISYAEQLAFLGRFQDPGTDRCDDTLVRWPATSCLVSNADSGASQPRTRSPEHPASGRRVA